MDHLREGLKINNVLELSKLFPDISQKIYTYDEELDQLTHETFLECIDFTRVGPEDAVLFTDGIKELTLEQISLLFQFTTGGKDLSTLSCTNIVLEVSEQSGVFASSCAFSLTIPRCSMISKDILAQTLVAITCDVDSFNTF